jgi:hypothetical protein
MSSWLRWLVSRVKGAWVGGRQASSKDRRRTFRPEVDSLEQRDVPTTVNYGGPVLHHVEVEAVFLGSRWQSPDLTDQANHIEGFLSFLTNSSFMDKLNRYGVGRGSYVGGLLDPVRMNLDINNTDILKELIKLTRNGSIPPPNGNRLIMVYVEPGVVVHKQGEDSLTGFGGYHSFYSGMPGSFPYGIMPYPGRLSHGAYYRGAFPGLTEVSSHELAEAVTDPQPGNARGWYNGKTGDEICDKFYLSHLFLSGYRIAVTVDKHDKPMIPAHAHRDPHFPLEP